MKCALVIPSWRMRDSHAASMAGTVAGIWPPTGVLYLAAALRQAGHAVCVLDGALLSTGRILEKLMEARPAFVGISSVYALWEKAAALAVEIRARLPGCYLAAGGPGPTWLGEACFTQCPALDAVMLGEGEVSLPALVGRLERGEDPAGVPASIVRVDGVPRRFGGNGVAPDLDALAYPAFDLIDLKKYRPSVGLYKKFPTLATFTSRGCPNHCIYCSKIAGRTIRFKSPERVGGELEYYVRAFGVREVKLFDDLFTFDEDRALAICAEIRRRALPIVWSASSRVDTITPALLREMKAAGCWYIHYGVESGVQKNLDMLGKGVALEQIRRAVRLTHEAGIDTFTSYILGIPGETPEEARRTIRFACELDSLFSDFFFCTPFPGTELYEQAARYGVVKKEVDQMGMHQNSFCPFTMDEATLQKLRREAFLRFYLRPGNLARQIRAVRSPGDLAQRLQGLRAVARMARGL